MGKTMYHSLFRQVAGGWGAAVGAAAADIRQASYLQAMKCQASKTPPLPPRHTTAVSDPLT